MGLIMEAESPISLTEEIHTEVPIQPEVSLNSVIGFSNPKTIKLRGIIKGKEVVALMTREPPLILFHCLKWRS